MNPGLSDEPSVDVRVHLCTLEPSADVCMHLCALEPSADVHLCAIEPSAGVRMHLCMLGGFKLPFSFQAVFGHPF